MFPKNSGRAAATDTATKGVEMREHLNSIVSENRGEVKNDLRRLRLTSGAPVREMVDVVRGIYPKYDKVIQSKVEHGDEYGINLRSDAMRALIHRFAPERDRGPRADGRTKPYRIQARLSKAAYGQLQQLVGERGATMQDFLESLILDYLTRRKEQPNEKMD